MTKAVTIGLVQLCSSDNIEDNIGRTTALIEEAAGKGAGLVMTPEMTGIFEQRKKALLQNTYPEEKDPALKAFTGLAARLDTWLLIGSLAIRVGRDKLVNRSFLIAPEGIKARYDKIHMFDVDLPSGEHYRESAIYQAGSKAVVAKTPFGALGLSVCYDLRFPYLYRKLAHNGAELIAIPSSFTKVTGQAHWHTLVRARAIETGAFVLAPAQAGRHWNGRETYGHSLAVDPWGEVLVDGGEAPEGVFVVSLDKKKIKLTRGAIPSLKHDRKVSD